jgi:hypothetical protein
MARLGIKRFAVLGFLAASASVACLSACSDDSNPSPGGPDSGSGAKPGTGGKKGTGGSGNNAGGKSGMKTDGGPGGSSSGGETGDGSTSTGGSAGDTGDSGSGGTTIGGGGDAGTAPPEPKCKPGATGFFTKTCSDSKCTPFDNTKLQNLTNGNLPPLE